MAVAPQEIGALVATVFAGTSVLVLVKAWARKIENQSKAPTVPRETADRMERMERAIDAVAVEIERISENQRFLTRLLAGREESPAGVLPRRGSSREEEA